ncbi:MAG TPA: rhamnogalacturonan acetylesterase [Paludibacteraceae bacterium]|nr:rhamnogalacturonan acetylesterase [Paludibacteraceae bacterium]
MKQYLSVFFVFVVASAWSMQMLAVDYKFSFNKQDTKKGFVAISEKTFYGANSAYGYDLNTVQNGKDPFFFSVDLPEGNYRVKLTLGNQEFETNTTVRSESRRLMLENIKIPKGKFVTREISVNLRNTKIGTRDSVKIKPREMGKLNWDNKLTLEINGIHPSLTRLEISSADNIPTVFLAGNSTVVDQDDEPWCGWGQILPRFMSPKIAIANYAESGEAGNTFIRSNRFAKLLHEMKKGDYLFIEFGHNDMKQKGENAGAFKSYKQSLVYMIDETRKKGGTPVLVTPMNRRRFDDNGKVINTLEDFPDAVRLTGKELNVMVVDLNAMSKVLYEAWGPNESVKAFVHYPAGTFPGQKTDLADNTHFNTFGGYEICKCILKGLKDNKSPLSKYIVKDFTTFDPAKPDKFSDFSIPATPFSSTEKPDGN